MKTISSKQHGMSSQPAAEIQKFRFPAGFPLIQQIIGFYTGIFSRSDCFLYVSKSIARAGFAEKSCISLCRFGKSTGIGAFAQNSRRKNPAAAT